MSERQLSEIPVVFTEGQITAAMNFWTTLPEHLGVADTPETKVRFKELCDSLGVKPQDSDSLWAQAHIRLEEQAIRENNQTEEK